MKNNLNTKLLPIRKIRTKSLSYALTVKILVLFLFPYSLQAQETLENNLDLPQDLCSQYISHQESENLKLTEIDGTLRELNSSAPSLKNYQTVRDLWIQLTGLVYSAGSFDEEEIRRTFSVTQNNQDKLDSCLEKLESSEKKIKSKALGTFITASALRTREISFQRKQPQTDIFNWTNDFFNDHLLEIKVIPLRWIAIFTSKIDRFTEDLQAGVEGWIRVAKDILLLLVFLFSLGIFLWVSLRFNTLFSAPKERLLRSLYSNKKSQKLGYWVQRSFPYLPWILLILFVRIEQNLVKNTYFSDLSLFFPYVTYYGVYKIFHIFVSQLLINFLSYARGYQIKALRNKIEVSAGRLSQFVIWSLVLLHTAESAAGEGFVYIWIEFIFFSGLFFLFIAESRRWEKEIESLLKTIVPEQFYTKLIQFSNKLYILRSIFLLIIGISFYIFVLLYGWFQTLEISKTLSARVFRERVKSAAKKAQEEIIEKKPKDYEYQFLIHSISVDVTAQNEFIDTTLDYMTKKKNGDCSRKNVGLIGESGYGKTYLLNLLKDKLSDIAKVDFFQPSKRQSIEAFLTEIKRKSDSENEESIYLVDNLHFLFLSKVGGFENIREFFTSIDMSTDNISWVVGINGNTWNYLDSILNKTRYFSSLHHMGRWSEEELRNLIIKKHESTGYSLSFDNILMAMKSDNHYEDKKYVEEKYFRILWEESLGNPEIAQRMWVKSLRPSPSPKSLNVGIPHSRYESIKGLPNEFYFVLASIVRHVEITLKDLAAVNDVSEDYIRNAVEFCEDKGYIIKLRDSVRLSPFWQNNVISTLAGKNYIYGK